MCIRDSSNGNYNLIAQKGTTKDGGSISLTADGNIDLTLTDKSKAVRIKGNVSLNGIKYD